MNSPRVVRCLHGANEQNLPIQGRTVGWARAHLVDALNIPPDSMALLNGGPVVEDRILEDGDTLEFLRPWGQKGVRRVWTVEQFAAVFQITPQQVSCWIERGLPALCWPDGTIRIPEEQVDQFLDQHLGLPLTGTAPPSLPPEPSPRVELTGDGNPPLVSGREKPVLTPAQANVVQALLEAGRDGLSKDELDAKSGHIDARKILKRLARDPDWAEVIHFPGRKGIGYRIV